MLRQYLKVSTLAIVERLLLRISGFKTKFQLNRTMITSKKIN
jgi:hypothetical protein